MAIRVTYSKTLLSTAITMALVATPVWAQQAQQLEQEDQQQARADEGPEIIVEQKPPQVIIEQPEPQVSVKQPEPEVTVRETEPDVAVRETGEPEVLIQDREQARQDQPRDTQTITQADQQAAPGMIDQMRGDEVIGKQVVNSQGDDMGEIGQLVTDPQSKQLYAVMSVGGVLGIGDQQIAVPLDELQYQQQEDQFQMNTQQSADALKNEPRYQYSEQQFQEVQQTDRQISQLKQQPQDSQQVQRGQTGSG
ncbi:PRC-barrel domain-containing protein [Alkalilimnicola sp. S0819]|uniref:PRC-barrel domain-containing protein n=1 Tax=Alkalilimnicola sp. S0819 TaxID=2613922 RepID=UPI001869C0D0|nr:PRC-barrel domain-containing protein [Alkalilimnicola sp. S0819]